LNESRRSCSCELAIATEGMLRMATLLPLPGLLGHHGVDSEVVFREAEVDPGLFTDAENVIPLAKVGRLLALAAEAGGGSALGLELGSRSGVDVLGAVGRAIRLAPDLGAALRALILHLHLHNSGSVPTLWEGTTLATFGYTIYCPNIPGIELVYDGSMAIAYNVLVELAGPGWRPSEVRLHRYKPTDITPYQKHFGVPLRFGADHAALVFASADLARPLASADPILYGHSLAGLRQKDASGLSGQVHRLLLRLFISGSGYDGVTLAHVAPLFELKPRTLNRRLRAEGTTFVALLVRVRYEIARQLLRDTRMRLTDIATILGYAETASFCRAFQRWSGTTATAWRSAYGTWSGRESAHG